MCKSLLTFYGESSKLNQHKYSNSEPTPVYHTDNDLISEKIEGTGHEHSNSFHCSLEWINILLSILLLFYEEEVSQLLSKD